MKKSIYTLVIVFLICCNSTNNFSQNNEEQITYSIKKEVKNWIKSTIDSVMNANNVPAISFGIVKDGKLAMSKGFGTKKRGVDILVDKYSLYQIGSDTKKNDRYSC